MLWPETRMAKLILINDINHNTKSKENIVVSIGCGSNVEKYRVEQKGRDEEQRDHGKYDAQRSSLKLEEKMQNFIFSSRRFQFVL